MGQLISRRAGIAGVLSLLTAGGAAKVASIFARENHEQQEAQKAYEAAREADKVQGHEQYGVIIVDKKTKQGVADRFYRGDFKDQENFRLSIHCEPQQICGGGYKPTNKLLASYFTGSDASKINPDNYEIAIVQTHTGKDKPLDSLGKDLTTTLANFRKTGVAIADAGESRGFSLPLETYFSASMEDPNGAMRASLLDTPYNAPMELKVSAARTTSGAAPSRAEVVEKTAAPAIHQRVK